MTGKSFGQVRKLSHRTPEYSVANLSADSRLARNILLLAAVFFGDRRGEGKRAVSVGELLQKFGCQTARNFFKSEFAIDQVEDSAAQEAVFGKLRNIVGSALAECFCRYQPTAEQRLFELNGDALRFFARLNGSDPPPEIIFFQ